MVDTVAPGASTVNTDESVDFAVWLGEYLTLTPVKAEAAPLAIVMLKASAGRVFRILLGSLRSLRVSSPVLLWRRPSGSGHHRQSQGPWPS